MVETGSILGGKYRIGRLLGRGGMGLVVEGTHEQLGTRVAIKVLKDSYASQPLLVERFLREARAAAGLRGEHICRVTDFGTTEAGAPYMVMELLDGLDLRTILDRVGSLSPGVAAFYIVQACAAIAEAHAIGLIHRDLKPGNLFLTQKPDGAPSIKILDFGLVKAVGSNDFSLTDSINVMGSPAYMSPEQLRSSKTVDPRTDVWALGVVLYELVTEKQPFTGESLTDLAVAITTEPPIPLPESVPAAFAAVIARCLEKEMAKRYADVSALAAALAPFASTDTKMLVESVARTLTTTPIKAEPSLEAPNSKTATTLRNATGEAQIIRGSSARWTILGAVLVVAAGLALLFVMRDRGDRSIETPPINEPPAAAAPLPPPPPPAPPDAAPEAMIDAGVVEATPPIDAATLAPTNHEPKPKRPKKPKKPTEDWTKSRY